MNDIDKIHDRINAVMRELVIIDHRLTALESHRCNCSAASSAGSGGTTLNPSTETGAGSSATPSLPKSADAATGSSDPVSSAIRDDPNRPAWLTDEMLPLPEGTERVYRVPGGVAAYPGSFWRDESWRAGFSWVASGANAERSNQEEAIAPVYHVPPPAPVVKAEPHAETAEEVADAIEKSRRPTRTIYTRIDFDFLLSKWVVSTLIVDRYPGPEWSFEEIHAQGESAVRMPPRHLDRAQEAVALVGVIHWVASSVGLAISHSGLPLTEGETGTSSVGKDPGEMVISSKVLAGQPSSIFDMISPSAVGPLLDSIDGRLTY